MASHMPPRENDGPEYLAVAWTFTVMALVTTVARLYIRTSIVRLAGRDDIVLAFGMIISILLSTFCTVAVHYGLGQHPQYLSPSDLSSSIKWAAISTVPAGLSFAVPKLAIAILIVRILEPPRKHVILLYSLSIAAIIISMIDTIIVFAQCDPPESLWNLTPEPKCWSPSILVNYSIFTGSFSAFLDFFLAIYPAIRLMKLQLDLRKKLTLSALMGLGVFAGVIAIVKCTTLPALGDKEDFTYSVSYLYLWTSIEANTIIIAACVPTLKPLLTLLAPLTGYKSSSYQSNHGYPYPAHRSQSPFKSFGARGDGYMGPLSDSKSTDVGKVRRGSRASRTGDAGDAELENGHLPAGLVGKVELTIEMEDGKDRPAERRWGDVDFDGQKVLNGGGAYLTR